MMPMDRRLYPNNWNVISLLVKGLARWTCQECGKPCRRPGESDLELFERLKSYSSAKWMNQLFDKPGEDWLVSSEYHWEDAKPGRFTLTVAHLDHDPWNSNARLKALCAPCHCRYDLAQMERKRHIKREYFGQLNLLEEPPCKDS